MKINSLNISNFRGIRDVSLENLGNMVIIAGQNGSGKSCIFDAIRLLKSVYGGYQHNEWQQWMGEFQIALSSQSDFTSMLNDKNRELKIGCFFGLAEDEKSYIRTNAIELLTEKNYRTLIPDAYAWGGIRMGAFTAQFRDLAPHVAQRVNEELVILNNELAAEGVYGECVIPPVGAPTILPSITLQLIFSIFRPRYIGVIDYHGAQRHYTRENVQGINLNLDGNDQQKSTTALYNSASKYNNVKSELAASYVKDILSREAEPNGVRKTSLTDTLKDLFETFFPEKKFLGPVPNKEGGLTFPVQTLSGAIHDLDDLSAGEKEILYGYLRIRNSAPSHSIVLLDEPELHLNPRLIRGLPQFYHKHLGEVLDNQIWLVTHSDALLREVIGKQNYNVYHMLPCGNVPIGESQLKPLSAKADLEMVIVDLVGDLATYRPGGKVVIFEGGGDSDFDKKTVASLFPELALGANLVSGSNKTRVQALHEVLDKVSKNGDLPYKFYSITDRDLETHSINKSVNSFNWDVYHIENYFLSPKHILQVLDSLREQNFPSENALNKFLIGCAKETIPQLIRQELSDSINQSLVGCIRLGTDPNSKTLVSDIDIAMSRSIERIQQIRNTINSEHILALSNGLKTKYENSLEDGTWQSLLKGREILKRFAGKRATSISYEGFRNLILTKMVDDNYKPSGMLKVISQILSD